MKHLVMTSWNKENRSEMIKRILESLSQSGQAGTEYSTHSRGVSYLSYISWLLSAGKVIPVDKDDDWIQVEVSYNGKCALDIFDPARDGRYFNSRFTEVENQDIRNALKKAEILTWRDYYSRHKRLRLILWVSAMAGAMGMIKGMLVHDLINVFLFACITIGFAFFLLRE
ncbi:MAG: hypothetical protein HXS41_06970 [Theionarchaea archaeon]|nr:hypothetical protein [Theionarchaea archaeon]MBU7001209.1 hypothetical protein [Theionarchaea archaeon]MBU7020784.1 hypothetical protein [Theionarchaea archaeon]